MGSLFIQLVLLVGVHVKARPVKANGTPWDAGGPPLSAPDLRVSVLVDGEAVAGCDGPADTFVVDCKFGDDEAPEIDDRESTVEVRVIDKDLVHDDPVGTATHQGQFVVYDGPSELDREGQLVEATVEVTDPPSLLGAMLMKVLAVLAGMALGGAIVYALRDRIAPPRQPPVVAADGASMVVVQPEREGRTRADELLYIAATVGAAVALVFHFQSARSVVPFGAGAFAATCAIASIVASKLRANRLRK